MESMAGVPASADHRTVHPIHRHATETVVSRLLVRERWWLLGAALGGLAAYQLGMQADLVLFALTLGGIALLHRHALPVALAGLAAIALHKVAYGNFAGETGLVGLWDHLGHEWVTLANLLGLLLGFALLAKHFEDTNVPSALPRFLPDDWKGGFLLLAMVFALSSFLDNIAAALIGGTMARVVFRDRVHIGYLAAIVAASNAGGAGSVVGDTTTTMLWLHGVSPLSVVDAYIAAGAALLISGYIAARQQQAHSPISRDAIATTPVDWVRVGVVVFILLATVLANVAANLRFPALLDRFPVVGAAVWLAILVTGPLRAPDWRLLPAALKGAAFLLALVLSASLMPVGQLPPASEYSTLGLGFVSSVFDNIPLTALAIGQGGYDWGVLAFAVGYGGSLIWFGSSAGVALSGSYPEARSVQLWLARGWHVTLAYVVGYVALLAVLGWEPGAAHDGAPTASPALIATDVSPR
jgi:Na+/H+ antiporter NhaD/arsenite permease-like protein